MMKKTISLILVFTMIMSTFAFADSKANSNEIILKDISLEDIPEGVELLEFTSEKEAKEYIKELEKEINKTKFETEIEVINLDPYSRSLTEKYRISSYKPVSLYVYDSETGENVWALTKYNVYADIDIYNDGSFHQITDVYNENSSLTGYTIGMDISDERNYPGDISSDGQSVTLSSEADLNYYLIVSGLVKLTTINIEYEWTYDL